MSTKLVSILGIVVLSSAISGCFVTQNDIDSVQNSIDLLQTATDIQAGTVQAICNATPGFCG